MPYPHLLSGTRRKALVEANRIWSLSGVHNWMADRIVS